jgi:predicted nucleic acid-binding protein
LTFYEAEDTLFKHLKKSSKGIENGSKFAIISSRSSGLQIQTIKEYFDLEIVDLTEDVVEKELKETALQTRGIHVGDSLHIATAIVNNAEVIITTDRHLQSVSGVFQNNMGQIIRCLDTDAAKNLL